MSIVKIPRFGDIITSRSKTMDYLTYRKRLREQKARLRRRLCGFYVWESDTMGQRVGPLPTVILK